MQSCNALDRHHRSNEYTHKRATQIKTNLFYGCHFHRKLQWDSSHQNVKYTTTTTEFKLRRAHTIHTARKPNDCRECLFFVFRSWQKLWLLFNKTRSKVKFSRGVCMCVLCSSSWSFVVTFTAAADIAFIVIICSLRVRRPRFVLMKSHILHFQIGIFRW